MARRKKAESGLNLWGEPDEEYQRKQPTPVPLDFEGCDVRMILIGGEPWWVASDVCRALEHTNSRAALSRLDDDEKGVSEVYTPGGPQEMAVVNEAGLFNLVLTSNKPEAKRFKRWLTHEVLPALRRTGSYSILGSPVAREARRLKCDPVTAANRIKNRDVNRGCNGRIKAEGGCPNDHKLWHNAAHRGKTGMDAVGLRRALEIRGRRTPLDRSAAPIVSLDTHAKTLAERMIQESGREMTHAEKAEVLERVQRQMAEETAAKLGPGYSIGVRDDPRRGKILDLVRNRIAAEG